MDRALNVRSRQRLAVLIDAENISSRIADELFRRIEAIGESITRRVYGDFSNGQGKGWLEVQHRHRLLPQQISPQAAGKNGSDIGLVIDAMDFVHGGQVEGICIVSSDSDFSRLALRAREHGLAVYGFGEQKTPESFRMACTSFSLVEGMLPQQAVPNVVLIRKPVDARPAPKPQPSPAKSAASGAMQAAPTTQPKADTPKAKRPKAKTQATADALAAVKTPATAKAKPVAAPPQPVPVSLISSAIKELGGDGGWVPLSQLGSVLRQKEPGFTAKAYGTATLRKLLGQVAALEVHVAGTGTAQVRLKPR